MASGDTLELTIEHADVGSQSFSVQAAQDITLDIGGYTSEQNMNGNLTGHRTLNAKPWEIAGLQAEYDPANGDIEFLQAVQNSPVDATITWQHIDETVYSGKGSVSGDLKGNTNTGYVALSLMGAGLLKKLA